MIELNERQTAKYLVQKIEEVLKEYDIALEQVLTVTCDNGANMLAAVKELDKHVQMITADKLFVDEDDFENNDELFNDLINELSTKVSLIRCAVHTLQLAVTDAIKAVDNRIRSLTNVAKNCRKMSYKPSFDLKNIPLPPLYSRTRWGGIFEMISNFYDHEDFYRDLGKQFKELDLLENWGFIHDYKNAFQPVYVATKEMQGQHVSLGDFYIHWLRCMMHVKQQPRNDLTKALGDSLEKRLHQLKKNLAFKAALLIDPRFNYISSVVLTPDEKAETRKFIISTSKRIESLKPNQTTQQLKIPEQPTATSSLDDFMTSLFGGSPPAVLQSDSENTFLKQLNALDLETHQNYKYDIWKHWIARKDSHPELSEIALTIMTVPATQVSVERAFSALALVLSPARTKLSVQNLASILTIKLNEELLHEVIPKMSSCQKSKSKST
ncbi:uncharacterized protein LOC131680695 [Topomyia yanbarensis]|uniref:uncharacterized protein LOC131680695 n=1 Tax=Topomyia yanbarensis TaxID=2498891 RepID=UPI00273BB441|nr:uncharacterized protein LOC131680695 [Topomyia yanbarensis]